MHDQREWETLLHPGRTVGPMSPDRVIYHWGLLLGEGAGPERLQAYAILADGSTVYLVGPHLGQLPRGLRVHDGKVSLEGLDECGQRVWVTGLHAQLTDVYLFVSDP